MLSRIFTAQLCRNPNHRRDRSTHEMRLTSGCLIWHPVTAVIEIPLRSRGLCCARVLRYPKDEAFPWPRRLRSPSFWRRINKHERGTDVAEGCRISVTFAKDSSKSKRATQLHSLLNAFFGSDSRFSPAFGRVLSSAFIDIAQLAPESSFSRGELDAPRLPQRDTVGGLIMMRPCADCPGV